MERRARSKFVFPVGSLVDGGLNPRISGAVSKIGTKFAVKSTVARRLGDGPMSTPSAAGGGGQRPAFTGVHRPVKIVHRGPWHGGMRHALPMVVHSPERTPRRICADSRRRQQLALSFASVTTSRPCYVASPASSNAACGFPRTALSCLLRLNMASDLLFYPIFHEAEALAGVP